MRGTNRDSLASARENDYFRKREMKKEGKLMEALPDEVWIKILELGLHNSILSCSDLCAFSISSKHFNKLSNDDVLWSILLTLSFPQYHHKNQHHESSTSSSSLSSKKTLYKYRLQKHTMRKLASIRRKIVKNEYLLDVLAVKVKRLGSRTVTINDRTEVLSRELLDIINYSPTQHHKTIEELHRRAMETNGQMKELSERLIHVIGERAQDIAAEDQAAPVASSVPSTSSPSSSTSSDSSSFDDFLVNLETKIDQLVSLQRRFLSTQQQQWHKLDMLLHRQREYSEKIAVLTSRLAALDMGSYPTEAADDTDDEDEDEDDDTEDEIQDEDDSDDGE